MRSTKSGPGRCSDLLRDGLALVLEQAGGLGSEDLFYGGHNLNNFITAGGTEVPPYARGYDSCSTTAAVHRRLDHGVDRQRLFGLVDGVAARVRLGMPRREQRARVLVGHDRDVEGAEPLRLGDDLLLVHGDQRPEDRHVRGLIDHRHVVERLRRDLADDVAGHERARPHVTRDPLRDAQHQSPVDDHAQIALHAQRDLPLQLAERHEIQLRFAAGSASAPRRAVSPFPATCSTGTARCGSARA